jgi:hypothetical protein
MLGEMVEDVARDRVPFSSSLILCSPVQGVDDGGQQFQVLRAVKVKACYEKCQRTPKKFGLGQEWGMLAQLLT